MADPRRTPETAKAAAQAIVAINKRWGKETPERIQKIADADLSKIQIRADNPATPPAETPEPSGVTVHGTVRKGEAIRVPVSWLSIEALDEPRSSSEDEPEASWANWRLTKEPAEQETHPEG